MPIVQVNTAHRKHNEYNSVNHSLTHSLTHSAYLTYQEPKLSLRKNTTIMFHRVEYMNGRRIHCSMASILRELSVSVRLLSVVLASLGGLDLSLIHI